MRQILAGLVAVAVVALMQGLFYTLRFFREKKHDELRRRGENIGLTTVYRTLPLLTESGLVHEMDFGKDHKFYDPNYAEHPFHNHVICLDCDQIVEFDPGAARKPPPVLLLDREDDRVAHG